MIDPKILDAVLPIPDLDELRDSTIQELKDEGFTITNFHSGGVFHTMLMIVLRVRIEFVELLRTVLNNMFLSHANGAWLDIKAVDFSKKRKQAQKTQGYVTISRTDAKGEAVRVAKGHVFKTEKDVNGDELRFFAMEDTVLQRGVLSTDILVEAELEGSRYNVPQGQITRSLILESTQSPTGRIGFSEKAAIRRLTRASGPGDCAPGRSWPSGRSMTPMSTSARRSTGSFM